jgi:tripartite ATP-independent transporter DctP family solute receptor
MKKMNSWSGFFALSVACLCITVTSAFAALPSNGPEFLYTMGHGAAEGSIGDLYCLKFKELVESKSNSKIKVNVYAGSQLGTYGEMLVSLQANDIQGMIFQPAPAVSFIPQLALLDLPYAFLGKSRVQIDKVLNSSSFTKLLDEAFEKAGYKRMSFAQAGTFREVTSNKELRKFEDFRGLNIRTLENKYHIAFWKAVGANPTPVAFGELYLALQQGLVDAQENPYDTSRAAKFQEVQKYVVNTHHILYPNLFLVNKDYYESMPEEYRKVFGESHVEAKDYAVKLMEESAVSQLQGLVEGGLTVIELPDEELKKMAERAKPVEEMIRKDLGNDVVDSFLSSLN